MGYVYDLSKILGVMVLLLGLAVEGYLSPPLAAILMAVYVIWRGIVRGSGGVKKFVLWGTEVCFLLTVCAAISRQGVGVLRLIYVMLGAFGAALTFLGRQLLSGNLGLIHVVLFGAGLLFLMNLGGRLGNGRLTVTSWRTVYIGVPIAALVIFIGTHGQSGEARALAGLILSVFMVLGALYIMARGLFSRK